MKKKVIIVLILLVLIVVGILIYNKYRSKTPQDTLTLYGNVDVRQVDLGFRVMGRVHHLQFEEGDLVEPGALMATLDKQPYLDQVAQARANVESSKVSLHYAKQVFDRRQELIQDGSVSLEDYENALSSRDTLAANLLQAEASLGVSNTNLQDTELYAPHQGIILTRIREPGSVVNVSEPVYTLSLTDPIWVRAYVAEPNLGNIYFGMPAEIHTDTQDAPIYYGQIGFISPVAEFTPKTVETTQLRTDLVYRLRVIVNNPDHRLKQGMPVTVVLRLNDKHHPDPTNK